MGFLTALFTGESSSAKLARLKASDADNDRRRREAEEKGLPFFGSEYRDDDRPKQNGENLAEILDRLTE